MKPDDQIVQGATVNADAVARLRAIHNSCYRPNDRVPIGWIILEAEFDSRDGAAKSHAGSRVRMPKTSPKIEIDAGAPYWRATVPTGESGQRERKARRTREAIVAAAIGLFDRRGFDATTVDEIAEAAEVSRRTVFRYFPTKEDILFFDWSDNLALLRRHLTWAAEDESAVAVVRRAVLVLTEALARSVERDPDIYRVRLGLMMKTPALMAYFFRLGLEWEAAVAEVVATHLETDPTPALHAHLLASAVFGVLRAVSLVWTSTDYRSDLTALTNEAFDLLEDGIASIPRRPTSHGADNG
jgi:AcrR family transcriptional regulator